VAKWTEVIESYSDDIATRAAAADLTLPVPSCPAWTLGDLVFHLGTVQRFWALNLLARDASTKTVSAIGDDPSDDVLVEWFRAGTASLGSALREVGDESPCWTWWGGPNLSGAAARHQVHEVAIHNWDAKLTLGIERPLASAIAHDGVSEFLEVHRAEIPTDGDSFITLRSTNTNGIWHVGDEGGTAVTVTGSASQLVLLLNGRVPLSVFSVDGSPDAVQSVLDAIDLN
jgi:uncharacterized protein (TIGR03083 family)